MPEDDRKAAIKLAVTLIEKETVYFTGKRRNLARKKYQTLVRLNFNPQPNIPTSTTTILTDGLRAPHQQE